MSAPGPPQAAAPPAWRWLRRALRAGALASYGTLAAAGALSAPAPSFLVGLLLGGTGGVLVAWLHRGGTDLPPLPHPAVAGTALACLPAAIAGTAVLGSWAGVVVGLGLVAGTSFVVHRVSLPAAEPAPPAHGGPESVDDEESLRDLLRLLPGDLLLEEWRSARTGPTAGATPGGMRLRQLLVDEILRRDPAGAGGWLEDGADDPPGGAVDGRPG